MDGAKVSYERLLPLWLLTGYRQKTDPALAEEHMRQFKEATDDDLNIPLALGFTPDKGGKERGYLEAALKMDDVRPAPFRGEAGWRRGMSPTRWRKVAEERLLARRMKDYARADELREKLKGMGWAVKDSRDGYELVKL